MGSQRPLETPPELAVVPHMVYDLRIVRNFIAFARRARNRTVVPG
jgi:hypothetical protein